MFCWRSSEFIYLYTWGLISMPSNFQIMFQIHMSPNNWSQTDNKRTEQVLLPFGALARDSQSLETDGYQRLKNLIHRGMARRARMLLCPSLVHICGRIETGEWWCWSCEVMEAMCQAQRLIPNNRMELCHVHISLSFIQWHSLGK